MWLKILPFALYISPTSVQALQIMPILVTLCYNGSSSKVKVKVTLRPTVSRHPAGTYDQIFITVRQLWVAWCGALCRTKERVLPFTIAAGPRQRSHPWVRIQRDSWPYFTVSDSRLPQPGGPGPRVYIPQEQDDPVITLDTGFSFRLLLRQGSYWELTLVI
jgi:hypothetical protein